MQEKKATLSVIVITFNEAHNIAACLETVRWADELIVVDSKSTDQTREIARTYTDQVIEAEWQGYAANKNLALARAKGDWILWLDADERIAPELAEEIRGVLSTRTHFVGYSMPRKAFFLGRWIRHCGWYPGHVLRLFRREVAFINDSLVHEGVEIQGPVGQFRNDILHFTDLNLNHYLWKFNRYTSLAAQQLHESGYRSHWWDILLRPWFTFIKMYLLKAGFLDGRQGFMLSLLSGGYVFAKYAKVWELAQTKFRTKTAGNLKSEAI